MTTQQHRKNLGREAGFTPSYWTHRQQCVARKKSKERKGKTEERNGKEYKNHEKEKKYSLVTTPRGTMCNLKFLEPRKYWIEMRSREKRRKRRLLFIYSIWFSYASFITPPAGGRGGVGWMEASQYSSGYRLCYGYTLHFWKRSVFCVINAVVKISGHNGFH